MKLRYASLMMAVALATVAVGSQTLTEGDKTGFPITDGYEENLEIARLFLVNSPTYKFDGIEETLKLKEKYHPEPDTWEFVFTFQSRQAGYGDRTGKYLAQVITPHTAHIVVTRAKVVKAVMDNKWNMMTQQIISNCHTLQVTAQIFPDQATSGTKLGITATVVDDNENPVEGATVTATIGDLEVLYLLSDQGNGKYQTTIKIPTLKQGTYETVVTAQKEGYETSKTSQTLTIVS